ncbi:MAG: GHKL domain-containing protein [Lachnospiraceae bacterium]|nr:GHKL domain-containing protein [Lachnospiraceae bacterium]
MGFAFNVIEFGANMFDAVAGIGFMLFTMEKKECYRNDNRFWLYTVLYIFGLAAVQDKPEQFVIQDIIIIAILTLYARYMLAHSAGEQFIYSMLFVIILTFAAMATHLFTLYGFRITTAEAIANEGAVRITGLIFDKLLLAGMLSVIIIIRKRIRLDYKEWLISFVIFAALLCISSSIGQIWSESEDLVKYSNYLFIFMAGFILMCVLAVICVYRLNIQNRYKLEYEVLKAKLDEEKYMLERVEEMYENNRILRHDLKRYLTVVQGLLINEDMQGAKQYIEKAVDTHFDTGLTIYTNSSVINAVINDRKRLCENAHIPCEVYSGGDIPEEMQMDMGIILSNLLENAYEAELSEPEGMRYIHIYMQRQKGMYLMRIENYIGKSILEENPYLKSHKRDKKSHGLGIYSVKRMVAGAEGSYQCFESGNAFVTEISLPIASNYA